MKRKSLGHQSEIERQPEYVPRVRKASSDERLDRFYGGLLSFRYFDGHEIEVKVRFEEFFDNLRVRKGVRFCLLESRKLRNSTRFISPGSGKGVWYF